MSAACNCPVHDGATLAHTPSCAAAVPYGIKCDGCGTTMAEHDRLAHCPPKNRFPPWGTVPTRPRCHCCGDVIVVDYVADDELWCAVMREKFGPGYVCIQCFASRADEKMIDWAPHVQLRPLSLAAQARLQNESRASQPDDAVTRAVKRFLAWPLPQHFRPDCGISFDGRKDDEWNKSKPWPVGTNLLTADQAKAMFEHCLAEPREENKS